MKFWPMAVAVSLALVAGCDRRPTTPPSPKTDISSATPTTAEKREGSNPVQGQVDPKSGAQHRDFQQRGEGAGPSSSDTKPTMKN